LSGWKVNYNQDKKENFPLKENFYFKIKGEINRFLDLYDSNNKSKGLLALAKETGMIGKDENPSLAELREIFSNHQAFDVETKLERLAAKYNIKIIWCPKFHCELNPIEGLWCYSKHYVRLENSQDFSGLLSLIEKSFQEYEESILHVKLWNRFWEALSMYSSGASYADVLHKLFGAKSSETVIHHKKNKDFNNNLV